jgi:hypothetical protein
MASFLRRVPAQQQAVAAPTFTAAHGSVLQRQCACGQHTLAGGECAEWRKKREGALRRAAVNAAPISEVPPIVHEVLHSPGQPLDAQTRAFMEPRFGHDFSGVLVHTDAQAAESARAVNALAYTVGRDVVFGAGQYAPRSSVGIHLMAHELMHVVQQAGAATHGKLMLGSADKHDEHQADQAGSAIADTQQGLRPVMQTRISPARIQREADEVGAKPAKADATGAGKGEPTFPVIGLSTCFCDEGDTYTKGKGVACDKGKCPDETGVFAAWPNTSDACRKVTSEGSNVPRVKCKESLTVSFGGKSVDVNVRDCGPGGKGRVIDLSLAAARALDPKVKTCNDWGNDKKVSVTQ